MGGGEGGAWRPSLSCWEYWASPLQGGRWAWQDQSQMGLNTLPSFVSCTDSWTPLSMDPHLRKPGWCLSFSRSLRGQGEQETEPVGHQHRACGQSSWSLNTVSWPHWDLGICGFPTVLSPAHYSTGRSGSWAPGGRQALPPRGLSVIHPHRTLSTKSCSWGILWVPPHLLYFPVFKIFAISSHYVYIK